MRRRQGFTVIELLAALGTVAVLAGVSAAVYGSAKSRARATGCSENLMRLGGALNRYLADHDGELPVMQAERGSLEEDVDVMDNVLAEYVDDHGVFACPADHAGLVTETGSSYRWNPELNGRRVGELRFSDGGRDPEPVRVFLDKGTFHERAGRGIQVLYADGQAEGGIIFRTGRK